MRSKYTARQRLLPEEAQFDPEVKIVKPKDTLCLAWLELPARWQPGLSLQDAVLLRVALRNIFGNVVLVLFDGEIYPGRQTDVDMLICVYLDKNLESLRVL